MTALELAHVGPRMRRHAPVAEYDAYLERWIDQPVYRRMLRHARDEFLAHYPDLEAWFAAPLLERVGRERRDGVRSSCKTLGYQARSYLHYLGLSGYAWFDWEWLLAVARHRIWELDERLDLTLRHDVDAFIQEAVRLGYSSRARQSIFWAVSRIVLHAGDPRVSAIDETRSWRPYGVSEIAQTWPSSMAPSHATSALPTRVSSPTFMLCALCSTTAGR